MKQMLSAMKAICFAVLILPALTAFTQNKLTKKEKKEGWKLLFDGKSMKGWRAYNNKASDGWEIINGELYNKQTGVNNRSDIITVDQYDNFELTFDWKVAKGANSGVMYHVIETDRPSFESGPEYQLIDDIGYPGGLQNSQKSGADYDMHAPITMAAKPAGEYNQTRLIVNNGHVEHWLNGQKVADFEMWTPEWNELKAKSKWKDVTDYGIAKKGYIALQDHGGGVWFRNVKIRKL